MFQFSFDYPLQTVPDSLTKDSLHYYLYGDALAWEALRLDPNGIPKAWYRVTGAVYWPAYIAWYGLVQLGHYLRRGDEANLHSFLKQVSWLEQNAVRRDDGAVIWPMNFDYPNGAVLLKAPWISAYTQGLVISALVHAPAPDEETATDRAPSRVGRIIELDVKDRGVRILLDGHTLYTETPGGPPPGILDGFLTSLIGLYELVLRDQRSRGGSLVSRGNCWARSALPRWDYRSKWSWYHRSYLSPPAYHNLNCLLGSAGNVVRAAGSGGICQTMES